MSTETITMDTLTDTTASRVVLQHGERVLVATYRYTDGQRNGWQAELYTMTERPIPGWGKDARAASECALRLDAASDEYFADNGSAIAWALTH